MTYRGRPVTEGEVHFSSREKGVGAVARIDDTHAVLVSPQHDVDGALGELVGIVYTAMADGSWSRLKACRSHLCKWLFYDRSRNRSAVWCSMAVCGNRTKTRAYRARRA